MEIYPVLAKRSTDNGRELIKARYLKYLKMETSLNYICYDFDDFKYKVISLIIISNAKSIIIIKILP